MQSPFAYIHAVTNTRVTIYDECRRRTFASRFCYLPSDFLLSDSHTLPVCMTLSVSPVGSAIGCCFAFGSLRIIKGVMHVSSLMLGCVNI